MGNRTWLMACAAVAIAACGGNVQVGDPPDSGIGAGGTARGGTGGTPGGGSSGQSTGGTGGTLECMPGAGIPCTCPGGFRSKQLCQPDGRFGPCSCPGTGGAAGVGGTGAGGCTAATCLKSAPGLTRDCRDCACASCTQQTCDCSNDVGCLVIMLCIFESGCRGVACYQDSTCKAVIDGNGGPTSVPSALALALSQCLEPNCPCISMGTCNPVFCPNPGTGAPCCITRDGPCGVQTTGGCQAPRLCKCDGDHTIHCDDGTAQSCGLYRCTPEGVCLPRCSIDADCVTGAICAPGGFCRF